MTRLMFVLCLILAVAGCAPVADHPPTRDEAVQSPGEPPATE